jgi:hypothetical protein
MTYDFFLNIGPIPAATVAAARAQMPAIINQKF